MSVAAVFEEFQSIKRLKRGCVVTEKIDGTNAQVYFPEDGSPMLVGSRTRWITPDDDNQGFARWAHEHEAELRAGLGFGRHYGEWWGSGIQRRYGLDHKRLSLFNTGRWHKEGDAPILTADENPTKPSKASSPCPPCCHVVPVLYTGDFDTNTVDQVCANLKQFGSSAAPGFMEPEGVVIYLAASRTLLKFTLDGDGHKGARKK